MSEYTQPHVKRIEPKKGGRKTLAREEARRIVHIKCARLMHKALIAKGIKPGHAGMLANMRYAAERRACQQGHTKADLRQGSTQTDGI